MTPGRAAVYVLSILLCVAATPLAILNPAELAEEQGYHGESHTVETKDGYILDVFRIRQPDLELSRRSRGPVLLMPGLACNAAIWILLGPGKALAYMLADEGHDVWLGSYRGNVFSRKHVNFTENESAFWDYSFEDIGRYDVAAVIDKVLEVTQRTRLSYIGHSMGSSSLMVLASFEPQYMAKVSRAYLMAPAVFLSRSSSTLVNRTVTVVLPFLRLGGFGPWGTGEIALRSPGWRLTFKVVCSNFGGLCSFVEGLYTGQGTEQRNGTGWSFWTDYVPDSMSIKNVQHLQQLSVSQRRHFRRYDYGAKNEEVYGTSEPPSYDLSKTTCPVSIYYGDNDKLVHSEDILDLAELLRNVRPPFRVPYDGFNHADFFIGEQAGELLYKQILSDMKEDDRYLSSGSQACANATCSILQTASLIVCYWMSFRARRILLSKTIPF